MINSNYSGKDVNDYAPWSLQEIRYVFDKAVAFQNRHDHITYACPCQPRVTAP